MSTEVSFKRLTAGTRLGFKGAGAGAWLAAQGVEDVYKRQEWWCHLASGFWFIAERDTLRDAVIATHPAEMGRRPLPPRGAP